MTGAAPRLPIVLAHGLMGFTRFAIGASYFRGIRERIEAAGTRVLVPGVPPTGSVALRAQALAKSLDAASLDSKVHIVAHSMGGLDARHLISRLGYADRVHSLTTLGCPHRGSLVADRLRTAGVIDAITKIGISAEAFTDLGTDACARFNETTPDAPGVRYASIAGRKERGHKSPPLRTFHELITAAQGENDGLVSVRSAQWGEESVVVEADHFDLVGWTPVVTVGFGRPVDVAAIWDPVLARLAAWESG